MIRGTSAQFKFDLPYDYSQLSEVSITFWQPYNNNQLLPIVKTIANCTCGVKNNELLIKLNPTETLRFDDDKKAMMQLFGTLNDGHTFASKEEYITVYPSYIPLDPTPTPNSEDYIVLEGGSIMQGR